MAYSPGLLNALFYVSKVGRIDGFHSDEDPLASRGRDQINEPPIAQQMALIWATQCTCALAAIMSAAMICALYVDGKIVVDEKIRNLAALSRARAFSSKSSFTTLSLVRKRMESPKNPVTVQNSHP